MRDAMGLEVEKRLEERRGRGKVRSISMRMENETRELRNDACVCTSGDVGKRRIRDRPDDREIGRYSMTRMRGGEKREEEKRRERQSDDDTIWKESEGDKGLFVQRNRVRLYHACAIYE